jgi:hypothetical protein
MAKHTGPDKKTAVHFHALLHIHQNDNQVQTLFVSAKSWVDKGINITHLL